MARRQRAIPGNGKTIRSSCNLQFSGRQAKSCPWRKFSQTDRNNRSVHPSKSSPSHFFHRGRMQPSGMHSQLLSNAEGMRKWRWRRDQTSRTHHRRRHKSTRDRQSTTPPHPFGNTLLNLPTEKQGVKPADSQGSMGNSSENGQGRSDILLSLQGTWGPIQVQELYRIYPWNRYKLLQVPRD